MNQQDAHLPHADDVAEMSNTVPAYWPQENQVLVRMYGQGLGDCFLLIVPRTRATAVVPDVDNGRPVYILIDCGVLPGTPGAAERMKRVVRDIRLTTRDETLTERHGEPWGRLDLLVITNSHLDHISGFIDAEMEWRKIQVDALWTAWTEHDDADELAKVLRRVTDKQRRALVQVADRTRHNDLGGRLEVARGVAAFFTDAPEDGDDGFAMALQEVPSVREIANGRFKAARWVSCEPGDARRLPGTWATAYVLGPPRNWDRLRSIAPSARKEEAAAKTADQKHRPSTATDRPRLDATALIRRYVDEPSALNAVVMPLLDPPTNGVLGADAGSTSKDAEATLIDKDVYDRTFPFDRQLRVPLATAEVAAARHPDDYWALASYFADVSHWRRIDDDWLAGAESFALEVDTLLNNTSLVLAIELPPATAASEARMLLFTSDAQASNWASWDEIPAWKPYDGARPAQKQPDIAALLKRVVFYKVGHHGAENATPRALGIERLRDDGKLTAFLPATADGARLIKGWANMPRTELLDALASRTGARIVLADGTIWGRDEEHETEGRDDLEVSSEKFLKARAENGDLPGNPLWVQIAIDY